MSRERFTPGPWEVSGETIYKLEHRGDFREGKPFLVNRFSARVSHDFSGMPADELTANAYLIAAAPELFEALEDFTRWYEEMAFSGSGSIRIKKAKAALAKARGKA